MSGKAYRGTQSTIALNRRIHADECKFSNSSEQATSCCFGNSLMLLSVAPLLGVICKYALRRRSRVHAEDQPHGICLMQVQWIDAKRTGW